MLKNEFNKQMLNQLLTNC